MRRIERLIIGLGLILIIASIVLNPFTVAQLFTKDKILNAASTTADVILFQIILLFIGGLLYFKYSLLIRLYQLIKKTCQQIKLALMKSIKICAKNKKRRIFLFACLIILCLFVLEMTARTVLPDTPFHIKNIDEKTAKYGEFRAENSTRTTYVIDSDNLSRNISINFSKNGFRRWGDINTSKTKALILGDSYTEAFFVEEDESYYAYLEKEFDNVEWFVFGQAGYGTLQEFMILDEFLDIIKPDLILWQLCNNDYYNNNFETEKKWFPFSGNAIRPYLEDDNIVYRFPGCAAILRKYSKIIDFALAKYRVFVVNSIQEKGNDFQANFTNEIMKTIQEHDIEMSSKTTIEIISMARERAKGIPFYLFTGGSKVEGRGDEIFKRVNITCIHGVSEYVDQKKKEGIQVKTISHGHWNVAGNKFAAEILVDYFKKQGLDKAG